MNKSVYSVVLSDDVVAEIDRLAYQQGTSRSNLMNQLLAEAVSYITPEKRTGEIFQQVEELLTAGGVFQPLLQSSDSMMSLRSALDYKYNPNVRYSVELQGGSAPVEGQLRVSLRSQNSTLILYLGQFFRLWTKVERAYIGPTDCLIEDGRYVRCLRLPAGGHLRPGDVLAAYIRGMDTAMKGFFANLSDPAAAARQTERIVMDYLKEYPSI